MLKKLFLFSTVGVLIFSFTSLAMCQEKDTIPKVLIEVRTLLRQARQQQDPVLYEEAVEKLQELIKENPNCFEAYSYLFRIYREQNNMTLAKAMCEKMLELNPENEEVYLNLIDIYMDEKDTVSAEDACDRLLKMRPKKVETYSSLYITYLLLANVPKAEIACKVGLEVNADDARLHFQLGKVYYLQYKYDDAEREMNRAKELSKGDQAFIFNIDEYLKLVADGKRMEAISKEPDPLWERMQEELYRATEHIIIYPEDLTGKINDFIRSYLEAKLSGNFDADEMEKRFNELLGEIKKTEKTTEEKKN